MQRTTVHPIMDWQWLDRLVSGLLLHTFLWLIHPSTIGLTHVFHTRFRYGANLAYNNNSLTHYARGTPLSYWTLAAHRSAGSGSISLVIYILFTVPLLYLFAIAVTWF